MPRAEQKGEPQGIVDEWNKKKHDEQRPRRRRYKEL